MQLLLSIYAKIGDFNFLFSFFLSLEINWFLNQLPIAKCLLPSAADHLVPSYKSFILLSNNCRNPTQSQQRPMCILHNLSQTM